MPRKQTHRSSNNSRSQRTNGHVASMTAYARDTRWATPAARRRTDVFVVDIADRFVDRSTSSEDPLALTA
jgi:hypothetical protein